MRLITVISVFAMFSCGTHYDRYDLTGIEYIEILRFDTFRNVKVLYKKDSIYQYDKEFILFCKFEIKYSDEYFFIGHPHGGPFIYDSIRDIQFKVNNISVNNQLKSYVKPYSYIINKSKTETVHFFSYVDIKAEHPYDISGTAGLIVKDAKKFLQGDSLVYSVEYELQSGKKFKKRKAIPIIKNDTIMNE